MKRNFNVKSFRRTPFEKFIFIIVFTIFALYSLSYIFVFIWAFLSSLKSAREFTSNPFAMPQDWLFTNYVKAFNELKYNNVNFLLMTFNSVWFSVGSALLTVLTSCVTGCILAKYNFKGKGFIFGVAIFSMTIPIIGNLASTYKLIYDLRFNDSPLILITSLSGFGFQFIVMHSFFKSIPWSYAEASFIDGGGHFYTFVRILLPLARGPILSLTIMLLISKWNDYMTPLLYLEEMPTLATGLFQYEKTMKAGANVPVYFAGVLMSIIPVLIVFAIFQDIMMESVSAGGLKG